MGETDTGVISGQDCKSSIHQIMFPENKEFSPNKPGQWKALNADLFDLKIKQGSSSPKRSFHTRPGGLQDSSVRYVDLSRCQQAESTLKSDESKVTNNSERQKDDKDKETDYKSNAKINIVVNTDYNDDIDEEPMSATKVKVKIKTNESATQINTDFPESPILKDKQALIHL